MIHFMEQYQYEALREVMHVLYKDDGTPQDKLAGDRRRDLANRMFALMDGIGKQTLTQGEQEEMIMEDEDKRATVKAAWAAEMKAWRVKFDLTQAEAAETLKVPKTTIEDWEQERTAPFQIEMVRELMRLKERKL